MLPLFFSPFFPRDGVLFSFPHFFDFFCAPCLTSRRGFFFRGWSSSSSSLGSISLIFIFISSSVPTATTLHRCPSKPFTLQKVSGKRSAGLGDKIFLIAMMDSLFSSSGQQTRQKLGLGFLAFPRSVYER